MPIHMGMNAIAHASALPTSGPKLDNRRVLAALIDLGVLALGAGLIGFVAGALNGGEVEFTPALDVILLGWALYYYFACESGGGQTIGKRLMRLRVVRADGGHAGMGEILVRTILRVIDGIALYLVGLVVMLVTGERRQRLGDLAAGTIVVDANEAQSGAAGPVKPVYVDAVPPQAITLPDYRQDWIPEDAAAPEAPEARVMPEAPAVSELRPFEPPHEVEPPPSKPLAEVEPQVEVEPLEPVVEVEPIVEVEPVPVVEVEPVPVVEVEPVPVVEVEPEPVVEVEPAAPAEDAVVVRSVETVSAIDLVMGGHEQDQDSSEPDAEQPDADR